MAEKDRLEKLKERLNAYYEAEIAVLSGQEYRIGSRSLRRAELKEIREAIKVMENQIDELKSKLTGNGRRKSFRVTLRDL